MSNGQPNNGKTIRELVDETILLSEQIATLRERLEDLYAAIALRALELEAGENQSDG